MLRVGDVVVLRSLPTWGEYRILRRSVADNGVVWYEVARERAGRAEIRDLESEFVFVRRPRGRNR